jgi:two-component system, NarL family, nitrate/nitrite response regulator NarL
MDTKTPVLIANPFPLVRNSIAELVNSKSNMQVVACAKEKDEVLPLADAHRPQVALIDLEVEWPVLTDLISKLSGRQTTALVMADELDEKQKLELLRAGANGIISRRIDPELLCRSVRAVAGGEIWVPRTTTSQLIDQFRMQPLIATPTTRAPEVQAQSAAQAKPQAPVRDFGLTPREWDIVRAIGEAMTNKDIAAQLGISEYTVKHHLTSIYDKIGVYNRLELAMMATHHGLVHHPAYAVA